MISPVDLVGAFIAGTNILRNGINKDWSGWLLTGVTKYSRRTKSMLFEAEYNGQTRWLNSATFKGRVMTLDGRVVEQLATEVQS